MANKTLQVRLQEKIDLASTWEEKGSFIPLKGEKIVYQIPKGTSPETYDTLSKTGDGSTTLAKLPFDSALAADVAVWAKPDEKDSEGKSLYRNVPQELDDYKAAVNSTYATKNELKSHPASYITSGQLALGQGGTGVALTQNPSMLVNLASTAADTVFETTPRPGVTGILPIANGGTGASTAAAARTALSVPSKQELSDGLAGKLSTSTKYAASSSVGGVATEAAKTTGTLTLKVAGANTKTFNGKENVELNITAQMLGIQNAVHFIGVSTSEIKDEGTQTPTISGWTGPLVAGDVVLYGENEFIWDGSKWEELGEASSLAKSISDLQTADNTINNYTVTAGKGLTGTGKISTSPTLNVGAGTGITVNDDNVALATVSGLTKGTYGPTNDVNGSNGTKINVPEITVDEYGRVTAISNKAYTSVDTTYNAVTATAGAKGLMTGDDKIKLNGIATGANKYSLASSGAYTDNNATYTFTLTPTVNGTAGTAMSLKVPTMVGATSSAASKAGLVPVCTATNRTKFLRGDGTWVTPTNTTYNDFTTTAKGLVNPVSPATPIDGENDILFNDHTWHGADDYIILCGGTANSNV